MAAVKYTESSSMFADMNFPFSKAVNHFRKEVHSFGLSVLNEFHYFKRKKYFTEVIQK